MYFDESNIDYQDFTQNQISNLIVGLSEQKIWNKKFKIRLTSKKTSKKLDLNVSYDLINRNLSKFDSIPAPPTDYSPEEIITSPELEEEPVIVGYETGARVLGSIDTVLEFGAATTSTGAPGYVDVDASEIPGYAYGASADDPSGGEIVEGEVVYEDGSVSYEPIRDGLVTEEDLLLRYYGKGITTQGIGFPVTVYQLMAEADPDWIEGSGGMSMMWDGLGAYSRLRTWMSDSFCYCRNGRRVRRNGRRPYHRQMEQRINKLGPVVVCAIITVTI